MEGGQTEVVQTSCNFSAVLLWPCLRGGRGFDLGDEEGGPTFLLPSDNCPGPWRQS